MSDRAAVVVAVAAFVGSLNARPVPLAAAVIVVVLSVGLRRVALLAIAVGLLCSSLAQRSWDGIDLDRSGPVEGVATVVTDPERFRGATTAVLRVDGSRYLASAWGAAAVRLDRASAGETFRVTGAARPYAGRQERKAALHVGSRLSVHTLESHGRGGALWRVANGLRSRLVVGADSLSAERRALFTGLVYGDDRAQDQLVAADFRRVGLTHLLAVSGQNVAYVLTMMRPIIERTGLRTRWVATLGVLLVFAAVTRFEPSVLRATMMAGLAVTGRTLGREAGSGRLLALAVTMLLIIDPLLAHTVAFRLSVAASAGIVWLRPVIRPSDRAGGWLGEATAVTVAAQLAVAPLLITTFGPVSLVSVPANVMAGPVAGLTMAWGMTGGLAAGFLPPEAARILHTVTTVLLVVLEGIARVCSSLPVAPVGLGWIAMALIVGAIAALLWRLMAVRVAAAILTGVLVLALVPSPVVGRHRVGRASDLWVSHGHAVLVLGTDEHLGWLLDDLHGLEVASIDALVAHAAVGPVVDSLATRIDIGARAQLGEDPLILRVGGSTLRVTIEADGVVAIVPHR